MKFRIAIVASLMSLPIFAQPNYPFGWTKVGQSGGQASVSLGTLHNGMYAASHFGAITNATCSAGVVTLTLALPLEGSPPSEHNGASIYLNAVTPNDWNGGPFALTSVSGSPTLTYNEACAGFAAYSSGGYVTLDFNLNSNQIEPWSSGGPWFDANGKFGFCIWGGGHDDYWGNENNCISNFDTTPLWVELFGPAIPTLYHYDPWAFEGICPAPYQDQSFKREAAPDSGTPVSQCHAGVQVTPNSRHTYAGVVYNVNNGLIYAFGGSLGPDGNPGSDVWTLDPKTSPPTYTLLQTNSGGGMGYGQVPQSGSNPGRITAYVPVGTANYAGHILMHNEGTNLYDFNPSTRVFTLLSGSSSGTDGWTAAVDPVNDLLVMIGGVGDAGNNHCAYPCAASGNQIQVTNLATLAETSWLSGSGCTANLRNSGIAWDSKLNLMAIYQGGGNTVELLNTNPTSVTTYWGTVASHHCIDVTLSQKASPVKGTDYPLDPDGTGGNTNYGIFNKFAYNPTNDTFFMVNTRNSSAWVMSLAPPNQVTLYSDSGSSQSNRIYTVGRFFRDGEISAYAQPLAVGGSLVANYQCDVKNRWPDGSLKFAIISFVAPTVATTGTTYQFVPAASGNNSGYLNEAGMLAGGYDFDGAINLTGTASPSISARSILNNGSTNCAMGVNCRYWLQGPVVTSVILEDRSTSRTFDVNTDGNSGNPLHPIFEARFYPQGNQVEIGFTLENSWASHTASLSARDQTFSMTLTTGNASPATKLAQASFKQYGFTRWRRAYWIGTAPAAMHTDFNWSYLSQTGAYPNYDPQWITNGEIAALYTHYTGLSAGQKSIPGVDGSSIVNYDQAVNSPGFAAWIGLNPQWDINWAMSGDPRMVLMGSDNADLVGRFPIFFREADTTAGSGGNYDCTAISAPTGGNCTAGSVEKQGRWVSSNARPTCNTNTAQWGTNCDGSGNQAIVYTTPSDGTSWWQNPDDATHIWDIGFIPYSLTGYEFYLENEQGEAAYLAGSGGGTFNASATYGKQGHYSLAISAKSLRDEAWWMRTMAYCAFISVDGTPEADYCLSKLKNAYALLEGKHSGTDRNSFAGLTKDVTNAPDCTGSGCFPFTWGAGLAAGVYQYTQGPELSCATNDASCLTFASAGQCQDGTETCYVAGGNNVDNFINNTNILAAESSFMDDFEDMVLGQIGQLGQVDTSQLLAWDARRYINVLVNPSANKYDIDMYVTPVLRTGGAGGCANLPMKAGCPWVETWSQYVNGYGATVTGATCSAGIATVTFDTIGTTGYYSVGQQTTISGITPSGYNGTFTLTGRTNGNPTSTLSYAVSCPGSYVSGGFVSWPPPTWDASGNYASQASAALSYMNNITTVEGYTGAAAWAVLQADPNLPNTLSSQPQWSILPLTLASVTPSTPTCPVPTFSSGTGTYDNVVSLSLSDSCGTICYTTDGSTPTESGNACSGGTTQTYSGAFNVSATGTVVSALATDSGSMDSAVGTATFTLQVATPTFNPVAGTYSGTLNVTVSTATSSAALKCLVNSVPTCASAACATPVVVSSSETLEAIGCRASFVDSAVGSAVYVINSLSAATKVTGVKISGGKIK